MIINVHAGHNPDGKTACGAVGLLKESTEARKIKDLVIAKLRSLGHTVYDCTVDNGTGQTDVLRKIVAKCNAHDVDLDVSIHLNAGAKDTAGNGKSAGTEVLVYALTSDAADEAKRTCEAIAALGYRNRGVKARPGLYVLRHTEAPAMLVECCFVDDADDVKLYDAEQMAQAIVYGITGRQAASGYLVRITAGELNVRAQASASSAVKTVVHQGEVFTIVEEAMNGTTKWGRLKSGAGWISLGYTEKV